MAKVTTVTYRAGYKIAQDYQSVEGVIEAVGNVEEDETPEEALRFIRSQVRSWLKADYAQGQKVLSKLTERPRQ